MRVIPTQAGYLGERGFAAHVMLGELGIWWAEGGVRCGGLSLGLTLCGLLHVTIAAFILWRLPVPARHGRVRQWTLFLQVQGFFALCPPKVKNGHDGEQQ